MWHRVAPILATRFALVIPDLRGYGWSSAPASHGGRGYTRRMIGRDMVALMDDLGFARFAVAGHDRGARVAYRLALDDPGRIAKLALLDLVPTAAVWQARETDPAVSPHWPWLAGPEPEPEDAITRDPDGYFGGLMSQWTKRRNLEAFDPRALARYRAAWGDPSRIHAMCEDYRAGATQDVAADRDDEAAGRTVGCPALILASIHYLMNSNSAPPIDTWRGGLAPGAENAEIDSGHFMAEENPDAVAKALLSFV